MTDRDGLVARLRALAKVNEDMADYYNAAALREAADALAAEPPCKATGKHRWVADVQPAKFGQLWLLRFIAPNLAGQYTEKAFCAHCGQTPAEAAAVPPPWKPGDPTPPDATELFEEAGQ